MSAQLWLADAARRWGLAVVEVDGWQHRGSIDFQPAGIVAHHTAGPAAGGDMPSLNTIVNGRPDLAGPLANYGLGRSGTVYVVASGRANHAGAGGWNGLTGNASVIGIEAENDGYQPWPAVQLDAYRRLGAAICEAIGAPPANLCRHHEWRSEKPDPHSLDGDAGRAAVAELLAAGPNPTPPPEEEVPDMLWVLVGVADPVNPADVPPPSFNTKAQWATNGVTRWWIPSEHVANRAIGALAQSAPKGVANGGAPVPMTWWALEEIPIQPGSKIPPPGNA